MAEADRTFMDARLCVILFFYIEVRNLACCSLPSLQTSLSRYLQYYLLAGFMFSGDVFSWFVSDEDIIPVCFEGWLPDEFPLL